MASPAAPFLLEQHPHHRGVDHRAAAGDDLDRRLELAAVVDAVLEQVGAALGALRDQVEPVARLGVLAEHDDPDLGVGLRRLCATRMPSSSPDGGMRTSVITTSGAPPDLGQQRRPVRAVRDDHMFLMLHNLVDGFTHQKRVVGERDADRRGASA